MNGPEVVEFPGSSNLSRARYDPSVENLVVEFNDGRTYTYYNVPQGKFRSLGIGGGTYFYAHIRTRHDYEPGGEIDVADGAD